MAYFLGLMFADGSTAKRSNGISLGLVTSDEPILDVFISELEAKDNYKMYRRPRETRNGTNASPFSVLCINSKTIRQSLVKLGVVPRKSFIDIDFPCIPKEYCSDFIRGHFDGDGSIFVTSQGYPKITIVGSRKFMIELSKLISFECNIPCPIVKQHQVAKTTYFFDISKRESMVDFLKFIYPEDKQFLFLERKRNKSKIVLDQINQALSKKGYGRKNDRWRVRKNGIECGCYKIEEEAIFSRNVVYGRPIPDELNDWQEKIFNKLKLKGFCDKKN